MDEQAGSESRPGDGGPEDLRVSRPAPGVVMITLERAALRNALRTQTLREIARVLDDASADEHTRAVVITGGTKYFAAGADLREMASLGPAEILLHERQRHWRTIATFAKPLLAAVNGYALGAGCELALCADIVCAGTNAQFGQPEINLGIIPGAGGTQRLLRVAGKGLTMQMVLTGQPIDANAALAAGIAVEVDEPESAIARAVELASIIASKPPLAIRAAKASVLAGFELALSDALVAERQAFARLAATQDRNEGIAAFLEKRAPRFTGR